MNKTLDSIPRTAKIKNKRYILIRLFNKMELFYGANLSYSFFSFAGTYFSSLRIDLKEFLQEI
jgi:hypothetical protein